MKPSRLNLNIFLRICIIYARSREPRIASHIPQYRNNTLKAAKSVNEPHQEKSLFQCTWPTKVQTSLRTHVFWSAPLVFELGAIYNRYPCPTTDRFNIIVRSWSRASRFEPFMPVRKLSLDIARHQYLLFLYLTYPCNRRHLMPTYFRHVLYTIIQRHALHYYWFITSK